MKGVREIVFEAGPAGQGQRKISRAVHTAFPVRTSREKKNRWGPATKKDRTTWTQDVVLKSNLSEKARSLAGRQIREPFAHPEGFQQRNFPFTR